tara:strand:- start:791 stop:1069 length:279 start_codon:yes stop_codon:yes gene_type:complete
MNWFLFCVTELYLDDDGELVKPGERGVGRCSMQPGIMEAPHGIMYVVTAEYVQGFLNERKNSKLTAHNVRRAIEAYYFGKEEKEIEYEFVFD